MTKWHLWKSWDVLDSYVCPVHNYNLGYRLPTNWQHWNGRVACTDKVRWPNSRVSCSAGMILKIKVIIPKSLSKFCGSRKYTHKSQIFMFKILLAKWTKSIPCMPYTVQYVLSLPNLHVAGILYLEKWHFLDQQTKVGICMHWKLWVTSQSPKRDF